MISNKLCVVGLLTSSIIPVKSAQGMPKALTKDQRRIIQKRAAIKAKLEKITDEDQKKAALGHYRQQNLDDREICAALRAEHALMRAMPEGLTYDQKRILIERAAVKADLEEIPDEEQRKAALGDFIQQNLDDPEICAAIIAEHALKRAMEPEPIETGDSAQKQEPSSEVEDRLPGACGPAGRHRVGQPPANIYPRQAMDQYFERFEGQERGTEWRRFVNGLKAKNEARFWPN